MDAEKVRTLLVLEPSTPCQLTVLSLHSGDSFLQDRSSVWLQTSLISLALMYISGLQNGAAIIGKRCSILKVEVSSRGSNQFTQSTASPDPDVSLSNNDEICLCVLAEPWLVRKC